VDATYAFVKALIGVRAVAMNHPWRASGDSFVWHDIHVCLRVAVPMFDTHLDIAR